MAEDSDWVVESIAEYLGSPAWVVPLTDFMENKCTVFDDEDENKLTYTEIHQQYKELVEKLLENYMQEVGINEEQLLEACTSPLAKSKALQNVFQPVLATEDFEVFKSLMVQKNVELQLQALRVIQERNGTLPECLTDGADMISELEQQELRILKEVLKRSKEEYEQDMARRQLSEDEGGSTSNSSTERMAFDSTERQDTMPGQASEKRAESTPSVCNASRMAEEKNIKSAGKAGDNMKHGTNKVGTQPTAKLLPGRSGADAKLLAPVRAPVRGSEPAADPREKSSTEAAEAWLEEARREAGISRPFTELSAAQQEQLQQRAHYLRQQRDRLLAMKREQRDKLSTSEESPVALAPRTVEISEEEKRQLQKRKHLAEKLKEEVIKKS
ncbi:cilia- and flagella-associated protein 36 [Lepisosteus oculatus]|uniref:cilia- and flagella-associated protein 36 n=1 Tax=Lepisosteus oculatus TaxID=7918 RepID=UPI0035F5210C